MIGTFKLELRIGKRSLRTRQTMRLVDGTTRQVAFGFAEGREPVTGFWRESGRFYCQLTIHYPACEYDVEDLYGDNGVRF